MRAFLHPLTLVCVLSAIGCGSKEIVVPPSPQDSGTDTNLADFGTDSIVADASDAKIPAGAEDACRAYYETLCSAWEKCNPVSFAPYVGDHATCVARGTKACVGVFDDPGLSYGPDGLKKCATSIAALTCTQYFRLSEFAAPVTPECGALRTGTLAIGAACGSNQQCASSYCEVVGDADCGKCTERALKGASCFATHPYSCEGGTICSAGKCVALGELDATCDDATPCHIDLACISGKCAARVKVGDACDSSKYQCEWNRWCNTTTSKCEAYVTHKLGDKCGYDTSTGSLSDCDTTTSRCNITNKALYTGTCMALAKDGEACTFAAQCEYPESCFSKVCQYRDNATLCK